MSGINNSIVIVYYKSKGPLLAMLRRMRLNEATGTEVIVVDSASFDDDGLDETVKQYPSIKPLRLERNRGFYAAANKGIGAAEGDIIVLCHADVLGDVHNFAELSDQLREASARKGSGKRTAAIVPQLMGVDGEPQPSIGTLPTLRSELIGAFFPTAGLKCKVPALDHLTDHQWARFACVALHRELLAPLGPMDPKFFMYGGDADYCARMHTRQLRIQISQSVRVTHAGAGINKEIPDHLLRILRKDQRLYADKYFGGLSKALVHTAASLGGLLGKDK